MGLQAAALLSAQAGTCQTVHVDGCIEYCMYVVNKIAG